MLVSHSPTRAALAGGKVSIQSVGQFRQLMKDAEMDTHLRKQLQQVATCDIRHKNNNNNNIK